MRRNLSRGAAKLSYRAACLWDQKQARLTKMSDKMPLTAAGTGPAYAGKGDAELVLDDGTSFTIHSAFLAWESTVLEDALNLAKQSRMRLPLQGTTADEVQALVRLLYSKRRESHVLELESYFCCRASAIAFRWKTSCSL